MAREVTPTFPHARLRSSIHLLVLAIVATVLMGQARPAEAALNICTADTGNPHWSTGADGVIVKGRGKCQYPNANQTLQIQVYLYLCFQNPSTWSEDRIEDDCYLRGYGQRFVTNPSDNIWYTQYAPPLGKPGARGTGYWVGCTVTSIRKHGNLTYYQTDMDRSNVVYITTSR